jgi:hypothetical protein
LHQSGASARDESGGQHRMGRPDAMAIPKLYSTIDPTVEIPRTIRNIRIEIVNYALQAAEVPNRSAV